MTYRNSSFEMSPSLFLSMIIIVAGMRNSFGRSRLIPCLRHCLNKSLICFIGLFTNSNADSYCMTQPVAIFEKFCETYPVYLVDVKFYENILLRHFPNLFHFFSNPPMLLANQSAALYRHFQFQKR